MWWTSYNDSCRTGYMNDSIYNCWETTQSRERPYQHDSTTSRLLCEVKHVRARLVLRWGTTLESRVLFSFEFFCRSVMGLFCHRRLHIRMHIPYVCSLIV